MKYIPNYSEFITEGFAPWVNSIRAFFSKRIADERNISKAIVQLIEEYSATADYSSEMSFVDRIAIHTKEDGFYMISRYLFEVPGKDGEDSWVNTRGGVVEVFHVKQGMSWDDRGERERMSFSLFPEMDEIFDTIKHHHA